MKLGPSALPPVGYIAFCQRQPQDCGPDEAAVLRGARKAADERKQLMAPWTLEGVLAAATRGNLTIASDAAAGRARFVALTPGLWRRLVRINERVNRQIRPQPDSVTYGQEDVWATPLEAGRRYGDCEDYVLEKRRALVAAGIPWRALNIAQVITAAGQPHAILLVATQQGEYVLDSLQPLVLPWRDARYRWFRRQVGGEPFTWVMVAERPAPEPVERKNTQESIQISERERTAARTTAK
jgi:predicted transglutaminase-like cysteine proteinase